MVVFDSSLVIRIIGIVVTSATVAGVIAGAVAVGIIASRGGFISATTVSIAEGSISVALKRLVNVSEINEYYDKAATRSDVTSLVFLETQSAFPGMFKAMVVKGLSDPILLDSDSRSRQKENSSNRFSIIYFNASVYFTKNLKAKEIGAAYDGFTASITLKDLELKPSTAAAVFAPEYSTFTDTVPVSALPTGPGVFTSSPNNGTVTPGTTVTVSVVVPG